VKPEELKDVAVMLRELSLSYEEILYAMREVAEDSHLVGCLWRDDGKSRLIKIGLALIALPDPTVTDILGAILVSAGIIQAKIKHSTLRIEDIYKTFPKLIKELQIGKQDLI